MVKHTYSVAARVQLPDFDGDRRYAMMEIELAKREMEKLPARSWLPFSYPGLGLLRRKDWRHYIHALEKYEHALDRHEREIQAGLVPITFSVTNNGSREDKRIKVHVMVKHGAVHAKKQAPTRPRRVDGAPNKSQRTKYFRLKGFTRHGVHIGRHGIEAEFSRLEAHDGALVVSQPLYFALNKHAMLSYEIVSRNVPDGQRGDIDVGR
jgi:hypothetical protein